MMESLSNIGLRNHVLLVLASLVFSYLFLVWDGLTSAFVLSLPLSYLLLGMLIKYGDQAYDVGCFDRRKALALAFPSGIWLGYMILNDQATAAIGVGMLLGLLLAGKYDNRGFVVGFSISITMTAVGYWTGSLSLSLIGLFVVMIATYIDEWANDLPGVDDRSNIMERLLYQRPFLKVAVLLLCVVGVLPSYAYLFMLLAFDFGYGFVDCVSQTRRGCV